VIHSLRPARFLSISASIFSLTIACLVAILLVASPLDAAAQARDAQSSRVTGVVVDAQGAAMPRAIVRLLDAQQRTVRTSVADARGHFTIDAGDCSGCRVEASLTGFVPASATAAADVTLTLGVAPVRESVLVSATRGDAPSSQVGASTTVISGDEIERRGVPVAGELLRSVPGVTVVRAGGLGGVTSVFVRGGDSGYNKVMLDGIPLNEPGGTFNFNTLSTDNLERIEVVRGAQSALFGSDAMSSVIQLVTRRGRSIAGRPAHVDGRFEGGGYGTTRASGSISGAVRQMDYAIGLGRFATDNRAPNSAFTNTTLSWNAGGTLGTGVELRAVGRIEGGRAGTPGQTAFGRPDLDAFFDRRDASTGVSLSHASGLFRGRFLYSYSRTRQESTNLVEDPPFTPAFEDRVGQFEFFDFLFDSRNVLQRHHAGYQADLTLGGLGAFATAQIVTGAVDVDAERARLHNRLAGVIVDASRNNTGVTLQYQALAARRAIAIGVRVEDNASFGTATVYRLSATQTLRESTGAFGSTAVKVNAGTGIKEPTILQSFSLTPSFLGNPDLLAERARTFDAGIEQRLAHDRAKVGVVWFDNRYRNQVSTRTISFEPFTSQFFNIGLTKARGMELTAETAVTRELRIDGGYTLTASKIVESTSPFSPVFAVGQPAFRRPRHAGFLRAAWDRGRIGIDVHGLFVGSRTDSDFVVFDPPIERADAYAIWTVGARVRATSRLEVFARVENLTDADYMEPLGFLAWRRTAHAGLRIGF
jgi:outer membrane cobalamin receptor